MAQPVVKPEIVLHIAKKHN